MEKTLEQVKNVERNAQLRESCSGERETKEERFDWDKDEYKEGRGGQLG